MSLNKAAHDEFSRSVYRGLDVVPRRLASGWANTATFAYTRMDDLTISGTAKKAGVITVIETFSVSRHYSALTMKYSIRNREGQKASSVAVFKRESDGG
jgi:hypothetical protein